MSLLLALVSENVEASPQQGRATDLAAVDGYVSEQVRALGIPGAALGIVQGNQVVHLQGFGVADSTGRKVTPQTPFSLGSVTKSFTALTVMQLVEAGRVDLDAPVQKYLPWFALADAEASAEITVRNLLNHTSGIATKDGNRSLTSQQSLEERVRGLGRLELTQTAGRVFQYSNLNYDIAGLVVQQVSQQPYADYVSQHVFQPLDMRHSHASRASALADGLAVGHHYMFGHAFPSERDVPPSHLPSGYLIASAEDLTHYAIAHMNGGRFGTAALLSAEGIKRLHEPGILIDGDDTYYAMGWVVGAKDGIPVATHSGSDGRNHAVVILMPDHRSGIVLLSNACGFVELWQLDAVAEGVFNLLNVKAAAPVSLPLGPRSLYWAVLLTPLLMVGGIAYIWPRWRGKGVAHIFLVMLIFAGTASLWLVLLPRVLEAPIWSGGRVNIPHPEMAHSVLASAVLGFGWSAIYPVISFNARGARRGAHSRPPERLTDPSTPPDSAAEGVLPRYWWRWAVATVLGEIVGLGGAGVLAALAQLVVPERSGLIVQTMLTVAMLTAGAGEGAVVGFAQSRVLRRALPALPPGLWIVATAVGSLMAWALGSSVFRTLPDDAVFEDYVPLMLMLGVACGTLLGVAQWFVLRTHIRNAGWWVGGNTAGWTVGLLIAFFVPMAIPAETSLAVVISLAILTGAGAGLAPGVTTGLVLQWLLRRR